MAHGNRSGFTYEVESAAHKRQNGLCALCGTSLVWGYDHAIPVYPIDSSGHAGTTWKKEVDNCMILCAGCFMWAKVDDHHAPTGAPHDPEDFKFSHGNGKSGAHNEWKTRMMGRAA